MAYHIPIQVHQHAPAPAAPAGVVPTAADICNAASYVEDVRRLRDGKCPSNMVHALRRRTVLNPRLSAVAGVQASDVQLADAVCYKHSVIRGMCRPLCVSIRLIFVFAL
jgi:hypothetical protein